jgi:hypothetical protein
LGHEQHECHRQQDQADDQVPAVIRIRSRLLRHEWNVTIQTDEFKVEIGIYAAPFDLPFGAVLRKY